jgi:hypothetical protein
MSSTPGISSSAMDCVIIVLSFEHSTHQKRHGSEIHDEELEQEWYAQTKFNRARFARFSHLAWENQPAVSFVEQVIRAADCY